MILIGINGLIAFTSNPMVQEKNTYDSISEGVDDPNSENYGSYVKLKKLNPMVGDQMIKKNSEKILTIPENATQLGTILHSGVILNSPEIAMKLKDYKNMSGTVLGNGGQLIPKNTEIGALYHVVRSELKEPSADVCIRHFNNNIIAMKSHDAFIADGHFNDLHYNMLNIPHTRTIGERMVKSVNQNDNENLNKKNFIFDRDYLNPVITSPGKYSDATQPYVAFARDYDHMSNKVFIFFEDCFGLSHGVGVHVHFPKTVVGPFVIFMFPVYVYFMASSLYGFIAWLLTTFLPYLICTHGTFTQFWPIYLMFSMVGWGLIYLVYPITNSASLSYIYSEDVWGNEYFNNTVCPGECTSLDESSTYYALCLTSFLVSLVNFIYMAVEKILIGCDCEGAKFSIRSLKLKLRT